MGNHLPMPSMVISTAARECLSIQPSAQISRQRIFVGLAYHHFNMPKASFFEQTGIQIRPKIVASAGIKFPVDETSYLTLEGDYTKQYTNTEMVGGLMYSRKIGSDYENPLYTLHLGGYLRVKDAFIPVVKMDYHPFSVAVSYDMNYVWIKDGKPGPWRF